MKILIYPHEILKRKADPIKRIDGTLQSFIDAMIETMYQADGVGLAANQVGNPIQVIVYDCAPDKERGKSPVVLLNPRIVESSGEMLSEEGCLSVPGYCAKIKRADRVCIRAFDREGKEMEIEAVGGLLAKCLQHEIDHLHGVCFVERLSPVKKALFKKKWAKMRHSHEKD